MFSHTQPERSRFESRVRLNSTSAKQEIHHDVPQADERGGLGLIVGAQIKAQSPTRKVSAMPTIMINMIRLVPDSTCVAATSWMISRSSVGSIVSRFSRFGGQAPTAQPRQSRDERQREQFAIDRQNRD